MSHILIPTSQVLRYDDGPLTVLSDLSDLEQYVVQNSEAEIQRRRDIRVALRALDGQKIYWPYRHVNVSPRLVLPWVNADGHRLLTRGCRGSSAVCGTKYKLQRTMYMGH
jgi:hypothetical protein